MTWLAWRQLRVHVGVTVAAAALLIAALAASGSDLADAYKADPRFLDQLQFDRLKHVLYLAGIVALYAAPALLGAFWGAPLVARELEAGTHRLVWNQSVTRTRWLATKLAMALGAGAAATAALSLAVTWWASPIDKAIAAGNATGPFMLARISPGVFGARGVVPVATVLFAVSLGVAAGLVLRRTVPALAVTLALVVGVQLALPFAVRPHLLAPSVQDVEISLRNLKGLVVAEGERGPGGRIRNIDIRTGQDGDWVLSNQTVDSSGRVLSLLPDWLGPCVAGETGPSGVPTRAAPGRREQVGACLARLDDEGYRQRVTFHAAGAYAGLQRREAALLLLGTGLLSGFCFWRIRRDLP